MPNFFGEYEIVAQTKNFLVVCDNDAQSRIRAQNVAGVCEPDLQRLNDLFSTNFEAGHTSDHGILVFVLADPQGGIGRGANYGYETDQSSRIYIVGGFTAPPPPPPPADPPPTTPPNLINAAIESPRLIFVAELAEILMHFTGYGWNPRNSMGEGLSIVLATLLHPVGYYDTGEGPRINEWLNGGGGPPVNPPRADFVARTENSDQNRYTYGCAILFINYLVSQRGYPLKDVIRASGGSLAQTYARLTGEPENAAYSGFNALLQKHIGNTTTNGMLRDNIFPLFDPERRSVTITAGDPIDTLPSTDAAPVQFDVKPGMMCPSAKYDFFRFHQQVERPVYARARGTATASFRWSIEGIDVAVRKKWTSVTINNPVTVKNPDGKRQTVANSVTFLYAIADTWNGSVLYLQTLTANGNCSLKITAAAREAVVNDAEVSASEQVNLDTLSWLPGDAIKKDWKRCNPFFAHIDTTIWGMSAKLSDLKNRPDPPSERSVLQIVAAVHELDRAVEQYAKAGFLTVADVWNQIGSPGGLRSNDAPAQEPDLTRLRIARGATNEGRGEP